MAEAKSHVALLQGSIQNALRGCECVLSRLLTPSKSFLKDLPDGTSTNERSAEGSQSPQFVRQTIGAATVASHCVILLLHFWFWWKDNGLFFIFFIVS